MESRKMDIDIERFCCQVIQDLYRNKGQEKTAILFSVRIDLDYYPSDDWKGYRKHKEVCQRFSVLYIPGGYTKVFYREDNNYAPEVAGQWTKIADHDSCWRDNWDEARKNLWAVTDYWQEKFGIDPMKVSRFSSIENIKEFKIADYRSNDINQRGKNYWIYNIEHNQETNEISIIGKDVKL